MSVTAPHITIALCTFNGAKFLSDQLRSFLDQTHQNWSLWVSDDGSTDATIDILREFQKRYGRAHEVRILHGPGQGLCQNYMSLLNARGFPKGYVALSDQDDVWFANKLSRALQIMGPDKGQTILYGAQSIHVDAHLRPIGHSRASATPPKFCNALVQNVVSGHSAVLSPSALKAVQGFGVPRQVPFHDWWLYQVISGVGGQVKLDAAPVLFYRQHDKNVIGAPRGVSALAARLKNLRNQDYKVWTEANRQALWRHRDRLTPHARNTLERVYFARATSGLRRASDMHALGLRRQAALGTAALYLAGVMGWT